MTTSFAYCTITPFALHNKAPQISSTTSYVVNESAKLIQECAGKVSAFVVLVYEFIGLGYTYSTLTVARQTPGWYDKAISVCFGSTHCALAGSPKGKWCTIF